MTFCPWCRLPITAEEVTDISGRRMHGECQRDYRRSVMMGEDDRERIEARRVVPLHLVSWDKEEKW